MKTHLLFAIVTMCATAILADEPQPPARMPAGTAAARFAIAAPDPAATPAPAVAPGSYAPLLSRVTPSVVSVFPASLVHEQKEGDALLDRFFGKVKPEDGKKAPDSGERVLGVGSGVILTADGWIVTNSHVVHMPNGRVADAIIVELHDHRRFAAKLAGFDPFTDLALLKIDTDGLQPLAIGDSEAARPGDLVFAVGNPFKVGITSTMGIVSAIHRTGLGMNGPGGYENFIQTDASINPGNSGGALVDATGRLIGINTAIYSTNGSNAGIGFAIPSSLMRRVLTELAENGKVVRGFFGLITADLDLLPGGKEEILSGAKVGEVMEGGPADKAGLKADDVIVSANGQPVENSGDLRLAMSFVKPGETLAVEFMRDSKKTTATLTAVAGVDDEMKGMFTIVELPGVTFRAGAEFPVVDSVTPEAAQRTQLEAGMEIIDVNGDKADSASAIEAALRKGVNKVKTRNGENEQTLAVRVE